jgi:hypothetical protein
MPTYSVKYTVLGDSLRTEMSQIVLIDVLFQHYLCSGVSGSDNLRITQRVLSFLNKIKSVEECERTECRTKRLSQRTIHKHIQ